MAYRWVTANSVWLEEEHNRFELEAGRDLARIDWQRAAYRLHDVAQLLGAALPASCAHADIYPEGFAFCPECGAPLAATAPPPRPAWWGATTGTIAAEDAPLPRHVPHGLAQTALPLAASLETRPPEPARGQAELKIPAPPNAVCVFAAATFGFAAQRLLALAFTRNVLQYWDPLAQRWHVMTPDGDGTTADLRFTSSQYAWLPLAQPARRGEVALVPSQDGLFRLLIDPVSESFRTEPLLQAPVVASPGAVNRRVASLFLSGAHYSRSCACGRPRSTAPTRKCSTSTAPTRPSPFPPKAGRGRTAMTASCAGCTMPASCCGVRAARRAGCRGPSRGSRACSSAVPRAAATAACG